MKLLVVILSTLLVSLTAKGQDKKDGSQKLRGEWKFQRPLRVIIPKDSSLLSMDPYLKKKPGVYRLKDGMPCIVPDTKDIAAIPNAWNGPLRTPYKSKKPAIPNPSQPNEQSDTK